MSVTRTLGAVATAVSTVAVWPLPAFIVIVVGLPVRPVAVKVTGGPESSQLVARQGVRAGRRAQGPAADGGDTRGVAGRARAGDRAAAAATAKVTGTPATGLSLASSTSTLGGMVTGVPTCTVWPLPSFISHLAGAPGMPVAVKVTGDPVSPALVAVSVLAPAVGAQRPAADGRDAGRVGGRVRRRRGAAAGGDREGDGDAGDGVAAGVGDQTLGSRPTGCRPRPSGRRRRSAPSSWPAPTTPVAVKVSGEPETPAQVARRVLAPAAEPRVQPPAVGDAVVAGDGGGAGDGTATGPHAEGHGEPGDGIAAAVVRRARSEPWRRRCLRPRTARRRRR